MATEAQIAGNRANAKRSTGPKTADGKARVARNATRHGLTAKNPNVSAEESAEFDALREQLRAEIHPHGALENVTFDDLVHAAWNQRRARRFQAEAGDGTLADFSDDETNIALNRLARYEAVARRAYYRAIQELRRLKTDRCLYIAIVGREPAGDSDAHPLVDLGKVRQSTKQSRSESGESSERTGWRALRAVVDPEGFRACEESWKIEFE